MRKSILCVEIIKNYFKLELIETLALYLTHPGKLGSVIYTEEIAKYNEHKPRKAIASY